VTPSDDRRGVALLLALVALLVIGALLAGALYRVQSELRLARDGMMRRAAEVAAERALRVSIATSSSAAARALPIGASSISTDDTDGAHTVITMARVDATLVWIVASASEPSVRGVARAQVGVTASLAPTGSSALQIVQGDAWAPGF
jgi:Tfp pilus assembly protein PilX